jgi:hypothetical protein
MPAKTRSYTKCIKQLHDLLDAALQTRGAKRIEHIHSIMNALSTSIGQQIIRENEVLKNTIVKKIAEFQKTHPDVANEWNLQVFGEELAAIEEAEQAEVAKQEVNIKSYNENGYKINDILYYYEGPIMNRQTKYFIRQILELDERIVQSETLKEATSECMKIMDLLESPKGQKTMEDYPDFKYIQVDNLYQDFNDGIEIISLAWPHIFGCEMNDDRYYYLNSL